MSIDNVEDIEPRVQYVAATGQTVFAYPFPIFESADLVVDVDGVTKTLTTNYTVIGAGLDAGGSVTLLSALTGGEIVTIYRDIAIERTADFQVNGPLRSTTFNDELDKLTMILQQLESRIGRAVRLTINAPQASSALELGASYEGKFLFVNSNRELEPADAIEVQALTQSLIGGVLYPITEEEEEEEAEIVHAFYQAGNVLRYGADPTGVSPSTNAFAVAFSLGIRVVIPKGTYLVDGPLDMVQGTSIVCEEGVTVSVPTGGMPTNTAWIRADNVEGISIDGKNSVWQFTTKPVADEQRIIFRFRGCTNLNLRDINAKNAGGDGFYFGVSTTTYCSGVGYNLTADNCRRNGYSIISAQNLTLDSCRALNIDGTEPHCGIDIEPNDPTDRLINVRIVNFYSENCTGEGVTLFLAELDNTSLPISVFIENHEDNGSTRGGRCARAEGISGIVRWNRPVWRNNAQYAFIADEWGSGDAKVELFDPKVIDCNQGASAGELAGAAIIPAYRDAASSHTYAIGSVYVYRPDIRVTLSTDPVIALYARNEDDATACADVRIIDPVNLEYSGNASRFGAGVLMQDKQRATLRNNSASITVTETRYYSPETNLGASGTQNYDLTDWSVTGTERTFEVRTAQNLRVRADQTNAALRLLPDNVTALESNDIGARLTVRRDTGGYWITERIGTWA